MEKSGLTTISLTQMPYITEKIGVPRAMAIEFPFGMIWGRPGDHETHRLILRHMLQAAQDISSPGTIVESSLYWPDELTALRDWWPKEKAPWLTSPEKVQLMMDFVQHGNPMK
jgi:hypothetical protein